MCSKQSRQSNQFQSTENLFKISTWFPLLKHLYLANEQESKLRHSRFGCISVRRALELVCSVSLVLHRFAGLNSQSENSHSKPAPRSHVLQLLSHTRTLRCNQQVQDRMPVQLWREKSLPLNLGSSEATRLTRNTPTHTHTHRPDSKQTVRANNSQVLLWKDWGMLIRHSSVIWLDLSGQLSAIITAVS